MENKKTIHKYLTEITLSDHLSYFPENISFDEFIRVLTEQYERVKKLFPEQDKITVNCSNEYGFDERSLVMRFYGERLETDEEYKARLDAEVRRKKSLAITNKEKKLKKEQKEKELFESLKKKYG